MATLSYPEGRFYEAEFPELDEIVVVQVKRIVDMGAYVTLLEYDGKEGMMLLSELSKRRIRSVSKLLKVGRTEICMVLRVDQEKGYIDLSKRRVAAEDATAKEETFAKAKAVHGIMRHVASLNEIDVTELCMKVSWPLQKKYGCAYEAFRKHINEEIDCNIWDFLKFDEPGEDLSAKAEKIKSDIETDLKRKLITQILRLRARIEVSCNEYEGIDAIKAALTEGLKVPTPEDCEIKIKLIAHPVFVISCMCRDKALGMQTVEASMKLIEDAIVKSGGAFRMVTKPEVVGQQEREEENLDDDDKSSSGSSDSEQDETMGQLTQEQLDALKGAGDGEDDDADA